MLGLSFMFALIALAGYSFYKIKQAEEKELEIFEKWLDKLNDM